MVSETDTVAAAGAAPSIDAQHVSFTYTDKYGDPSIHAISDVTFSLPPSARVLLIGANGSGKSTLLKLVAGQHLLPDKKMLTTLGTPCVIDTGVTYLGGDWKRTVSFAGAGVPYQADIKARDMMQVFQEKFSERRDKLVELLDIDLNWRMHTVSDGQRRRVQIMLGLLRPFKVLLLDEMTVDLDLVARADLLAYLKEECEKTGATVLYATHIFDGMDDWPTHFLFLEQGRLVKSSSYAALQKEPGYTTLYRYVLDYLHVMQKKRKQEAKERGPAPEQPFRSVLAHGASGFTPGRMHAYALD